MWGEMRLWNTGLSDCVRRERGSGQRHIHLGGSLNLNNLASERKVGHCAAFEHSHQATIRTCSQVNTQVVGSGSIRRRGSVSKRAEQVLA